MTLSIELWSNTAPRELISKENEIREYYNYLKQLTEITTDFDHDIYILEDILQEIGIAKAEEAAILKDTECPPDYYEWEDEQAIIDIEDCYWDWYLKYQSEGDWDNIYE